MTPVTLTQNSYRLWARIGGVNAVVMYSVTVAPTAANVAAQLLQLAEDQLVHETP